MFIKIKRKISLTVIILLFQAYAVFPAQPKPIVCFNQFSNNVFVGYSFNGNGDPWELHQNMLLRVHNTGGGMTGDGPYLEMTQDFAISPNQPAGAVSNMFFAISNDALTVPVTSNSQKYRIEMDYKTSAKKTGDIYVNMYGYSTQARLLSSAIDSYSVPNVNGWAHLSVVLTTDNFGASNSWFYNNNVAFMVNFFNKGPNDTGNPPGTPGFICIANLKIYEVTDGENTIDIIKDGVNIGFNAILANPQKDWSAIAMKAPKAEDDPTLTDDDGWFKCEYVTNTGADNGKIRFVWRNPLYLGDVRYYQQYNIYQRLPDGTQGSLVKFVNGTCGTASTEEIDLRYGKYILNDDRYMNYSPFDFIVKSCDMYGNESDGLVVKNPKPSLTKFMVDQITSSTIGTANVSVRVTNLTSVPYNFTMITALYGDKKLIKLNASNKSVSVMPGDSSQIKKITNSITIEPGELSEYNDVQLRAYIWDGLHRMKPMEIVPLQLTASLGQHKKGNIFFSNEDKMIDITTNSDTVKISMVDYWGAVREQIETITDGFKTITLPPDLAPGYYDLYVYGDDGREIPLIKTSMAVITPFDFTRYSHTQSDFGVCTHLGRRNVGWSFDLIDEITAMGAKIIRNDLSWAASEQHTRGNYSLNAYDVLPAMLEARNMGFIMSSGYTNPLYDNNNTPYTDDGRQGFADYVKAMRQLFGNRLIGVDMYNEMHNTKFLSGPVKDAVDSPGTGTLRYDAHTTYVANLQRVIYETVKPVYPDVIILSNHIRNDRDDGRWTGWMDKLLSKGASYMDGVYPHPYYYRSGYEGIDLYRIDPENRIPEFINDLNGLFDKYNVPAEKRHIWFTEQGTSTATGYKTERTQAQYVPRAYAVAKHFGVGKQIWYDFMDDGADPADVQHNFGFIRHKDSALGAYTPKPSFVAYAVMARQLTNTAYLGGGFPGDAYVSNNIHWFKFENEYGETVNLVWHYANSGIQSANVTVTTTSSEIEVTDIMGAVRSYTPQNGSVMLNISNDVLYIKGNITNIN